MMFDFRHLPSQTFLTSSSPYTVPSGKFAKIDIRNSSLPKLDGNNLYFQESGNNSDVIYIGLFDTFYITEGQVITFTGGKISVTEYEKIQ